MPNYTGIRSKLDSGGKAAALQAQIIAAHNQCKAIQSALALYTAATDADFNAAINSIFTAGERSQLNQMLTQASNLVSNWETNHSNLLTMPE